MKINQTTLYSAALFCFVVAGFVVVNTFLFSPYESNNTPQSLEQTPTPAITNNELAGNKEADEAHIKQAKVEFVTEELAQQLKTVAIAYKQQAKYPNFSTPVLHPELAKTPEPFAESRVSMPTFDDQGNVTDITIAASVDKLSYLVGEPITFQVLIEGAVHDIAVFAEIDVKNPDTNDYVAQNINLMPANQSDESDQSELLVSINSDSLALKKSSQELLAVVNIDINGKQHVSTVPFILSQSSARLVGIKDTQQQDDFLEIALDYDVEQAGYYFVTAYLDDAGTGKPLVALQSEGKMSKGSSQLTLKAHHQALKDAGSEGPYELRVVQSYRGAAPGEGDDVYAAISESSFPIPDFSFEGYTDTPYSDPIVNARINALLELGNGK